MEQPKTFTQDALNSSKSILTIFKFLTGQRGSCHQKINLLILLIMNLFLTVTFNFNKPIFLKFKLKHPLKICVWSCDREKINEP